MKKNSNGHGLFLWVPADNELCDKVWNALSVSEKTLALNAVYESRK